MRFPIAEPVYGFDQYAELAAFAPVIKRKMEYRRLVGPSAASIFNLALSPPSASRMRKNLKRSKR